MLFCIDPNLSFRSMNISLIHFKTLNRFYYSSAVNYAAIHKTFRKVLGAGISKKRKLKFQESPILPSVTRLNKISGETKHCSSRRASMLNKMFMRYVTDLIVNGEHWEEYAQNGIEINRVEVSPDYKNVNIFWISEENDKEDVIVNFLADNAYTLRHELSQLRVMGMVPPITFIKDKHQSELKDLDRRIASADYGMDYEHTSVSRVKHQLELYSRIDDKHKTELEKLEEDEEDLDMDLPEMPQNVLGLDYSVILNKIQKSKNSSETNRQDSNYVARAGEYNGDEGNLSSREAFISFLQRRQVDAKKMNQENKNRNFDMEYIKQELQENSPSDHYKNIENNLDSFDDDFIEDETENK